MTKKKWLDRCRKAFIKLTDASFNAFAKEMAEVAYKEYGDPRSSCYDKDYSPEDAASDEYDALCSDA